MGPLNPSRTSRGSQPEWSMCPWVSTTASIVSGGTAKRSQFRSRRCFSPWNKPQSTSTREPPISSTCREPETMPAAPRKVMLSPAREAFCCAAIDAISSEVIKR